ncbi:MAG: exo-alpha-sialidase [Phycisphaeraceae bacterium]|nr:exo-alpha-sialidase [Phycisphaeraceae bacterium]
MMYPLVVRLITCALVPGAVVGHAPAQENAWIPLNGPTGGIVQVVTYDPASGAVLAGTSFGAGYNQTGGSVFRTVDRAANWTLLGNELASLPQNFTNVRTIVAAATGHLFVGMDPIGVYRSTDGGTHWSALNTGLPNGPPVRRIAIGPAGQTLCALNGAGVYQLNAPGTAWSAINSGLTNLNASALAFGTDAAFVGTRGGGVFKRVGAGAWAAANNGLGGLQINDLAALPLGLCACTDSGVFVSTDDAASWMQLTGPFSAGYVGTIAAAGSSLLIGSTLTAYRSVDGGINWDPILVGQSVRAFATDGQGRVYAGTNQLGMLTSDDDGATWTTMNRGLCAQSVFRVMQTGAGLFAGTQRNGIIRSRDGGQTWDPAQLPERAIFALAASPWGDLFAGNYTIAPGGVPDGHAWRSTDGGDSWQPLDSGLNASMVSGLVFPGPGEVLCSSAWNPGGVSRSFNNGSSWSRLGPPQNIPAYFLSRSNAGDLYIGSEGQGVWKLPAGGATWEFKGLTSSQQFSMAFGSGGRVYVGNDGHIKGVWMSVDDGETFQPVNSFPSNWGYAVVVAPNDDVYVATRDAGVQRSIDGGASWETFNSGIPTTACYALSIGEDGHLYAGSAGHGVYRSVARITPCAADFDGNGLQDIADIFAFLTAWFASDPAAFSFGGTPGVPAIFAYLSVWFAGCS